MNNVIYCEFGRSDNLSYILDGETGKKVMSGCSINNGEISAIKDCDNFKINSMGYDLSREDMAKFLWMAAYMVDSKQEYVPCELVCFD